MIDRSKVTVEHILLVMKTLGKFHAVSFAMRDQEPEKYSEIVSQITEMFFIRGVETPFCTTVNSAAMNAINCITDDRDAHLVKTLLDIYEKNQYDLLADLLVGDEAEPYAVITHGDLWNNNTMFHYDDKNTLQKVCFIDWQLVRYGSPVLDLMYYIFFNTTREQRGRNYNIYLKTYYDSLASLLQRFIYCNRLMISAQKKTNLSNFPDSVPTRRECSRLKHSRNNYSSSGDMEF